MTSLLLTLLAVLSFYQILSSASKTTTYDVVKLGARGDGKTDTTKSFLKAWSAACRSTDAATIYVPPGRYLVGNAVFDGEKCKNSDITFSITGSTLVAPANYKASNWILFKAVNGVTITGGKLDGQATGLWACKNSGKSCPNGATVSAWEDELGLVRNIHHLECPRIDSISTDPCPDVVRCVVFYSDGRRFFYSKVADKRYNKIEPPHILCIEEKNNFEARAEHDKIYAENWELIKKLANINELDDPYELSLTPKMLKI